MKISVCLLEYKIYFEEYNIMLFFSFSEGVENSKYNNISL